MVKSSWLSTLAAVSVALVATGCGAASRQEKPRAALPPQAVQPAPAPVVPTPPPDPVQALIDQSQQHYQLGQRELEVGHIDDHRRAAGASRRGHGRR
jgi:hypothetical protein